MNFEFRFDPVLIFIQIGAPAAFLFSTSCYNSLLNCNYKKRNDAKICRSNVTSLVDRFISHISTVLYLFPMCLQIPSLFNNVFPSFDTGGWGVNGSRESLLHLQILKIHSCRFHAHGAERHDKVKGAVFFITS